jgi:hypothetical protein
MITGFTISFMLEKTSACAFKLEGVHVFYSYTFLQQLFLPLTDKPGRQAGHAMNACHKEIDLHN